MAGVIYAGKASNVFDGTLNQKFDEFEVTFDGDVVDTSNYLDGGFLSNIDGNNWSHATVSGPYNTGQMTHTRGATATWTFTVGGSIAFQIPVRIKSIKISSKYKGTAPTRVSYDLVSNGAFVPTLL